MLWEPDSPFYSGEGDGDWGGYGMGEAAGCADMCSDCYGCGEGEGEGIGEDGCSSTSFGEASGGWRGGPCYGLAETYDKTAER